MANTPSAGKGVSTFKATLAVIGFTLLAYIICVAATALTFKSDPLTRLLVTPIVPAVVAMVAFAWSQRWKCRALRG